MTALGWICYIFILRFMYCYDNLSRLSSTVVSQSSTFRNRNASYANDGGINKEYHHCAHTAFGHNKAWFQVDFRAPYSFKSIKITYRDDGPNEWRPYRFRQFYLDVANVSAASSLTTDRFRCYQDNTPNGVVPPNVVDIPCKQTARYVIVETTYDMPNDTETGAVLEICEIEVYGCPLQRYGNNCESCGDCRYCDIELGCGCREGYYAEDCTLPCPPNCKNDRCTRDIGTCTEGCKSGYFGNNCSVPCLRGAFCFNKTCHQQNGTCKQGCVAGWQEPYCNASVKRDNQMLSDGDSTTIIGAGVGSVAVIAIAVIIVVAVLKYSAIQRANQVVNDNSC